jgi:hypothetical protein
VVLLPGRVDRVVALLPGHVAGEARDEMRRS